MDAFCVLTQRIGLCFGDEELKNLATGLTLNVRMFSASDSVVFSIADATLSWAPVADAPEVTIHASESAWETLLACPPPPTFHSFTALQMANDAFEVTGAPQLIAQARPALERVIELCVRTQAAQVNVVRRDMGQIVGRYVSVIIEGERHDIYVESAGRGRPVLFLHTAGADSRQFRSQLSDVDLAEHYAMVAVDLPFHGKSMPPASWRGERYILTQQRYLDYCTAIIESLFDEAVIVVGGSMGAAISLVLAAERPDLLCGAMAVEPPFRSKGRRNPYQHHVGVHGALHNASYVRGLMSPLSPEAHRRQAAWIYSQGAPGVYTGDLAFYSDEFDGARVAPRIRCERTPVVLLCGAYDYSASPADGRKLEALMPGCKMFVMDGLGHFPMCENPDLFRAYLLQGLEAIVQHKAAAVA